jgi:hypothetical protein
VFLCEKHGAYFIYILSIFLHKPSFVVSFCERISDYAVNLKGILDFHRILQVDTLDKDKSHVSLLSLHNDRRHRKQKETPSFERKKEDEEETKTKKLSSD